MGFRSLGFRGLRIFVLGGVGNRVLGTGGLWLM